MNQLRDMAGPTVKAWKTLFPAASDAELHELREALASYGEMLEKHHMAIPLKCHHDAPHYCPNCGRDFAALWR